MVFGLKLGLPRKGPAEPPPQDGGGASSSKSSGNEGVQKGALTVNEFVARTKRCREKGLEPTKPELIAYARYLGIDPIADGDLMWIADEALNAPLPSEWTEHNDSAERIFYYNVQTHASSWTHPLEQLHRDSYKGIVNFRSGDLSKDDQAVELEKLRRHCEDIERDAHKELQAWTEHTDEQGQKFFYNRDTKSSVWTDPRPARCHTLYLQMKALRCVSKYCGQTVPAREISRDMFADPKRWELGKSVQRPSGNDVHMKGSTHPPALGVGEPREETEKERKRKKKRKDKESKEEFPLAPMSDVSLPEDDSDPLGIGKKRNIFDTKKPQLASVEEVRSALGVGGGGIGGGLPPLGRMPLSLPGPHGRLSSPLDGLSSVGRAKVRAGIKLEPLKGGA